MHLLFTEHYAVCSAHAEVIPRTVVDVVNAGSLLRTRGGDPEYCLLPSYMTSSAPHTRR